MKISLNRRTRRNSGPICPRLAMAAITALLYASGCAPRSSPPDALPQAQTPSAAVVEEPGDGANGGSPEFLQPAMFQGPPLRPPPAAAPPGSFPTEIEDVPPPAPVPDSAGSSSSSSEADQELAEELVEDSYAPGAGAPAYQPARSRLFRRYDQWTEAETAAHALGRLGAAAAAEVTALLADPDPAVRLRAAEILARIGPEAATAVDPLVRILEQDPDPGVRKAAAFALGQMGPEASPAVPALMELLRRQSP
jgi:hypothetical protein